VSGAGAENGAELTRQSGAGLEKIRWSGSLAERIGELGLQKEVSRNFDRSRSAHMLWLVPYIEQVGLFSEFDFL